MTTKKNRNYNKSKKLTQKYYIILEKYKKNIFGVDTNIYILKFKTNYNCKNLTLKKKPNYIKKNILDFLQNNAKVDKVFTKKIYTKDKNIMSEIISSINTNEKYTYCLNKNTLIFAETKTRENNSLLKDWLSKHITLCDNTACASGEMVIHENAFVFDNKSGTFQPSFSDLKSLKRALPFFNIKIVSRYSKTHDKYYEKYD